MLFIAAKSRFYDFISQINGIPYYKRRNVRFADDYQSLNTEVADYFGILGNNEENLKINIDKVNVDDANDIYCILSVEYKRKNDEVYETLYQITQLPECVLENISDYVYNHNYLRLKFKITFPNDYPFGPPLWSMVSIDNTIKHDALAYGGLTLTDYYNHLVEVHNRRYRDENRQWYPNITVEKDVLMFLTRINHFDCIGI